MTEREAGAWAARLTRIWMPDGSFGEGATWKLQDGQFHYIAPLTEELEMSFDPSDQNRNRGFHLRRTHAGRLTGHLYCPEDEGRVQNLGPLAGVSEEDSAQFARLYTPLMQRYCYLSGCPIEASEQEQELWTGWLREREDEGQGEPANTPEWEAQRVAAAFGGFSFTVHRTAISVHYEGWVDEVLVTWRLGDPNARVKNICVGTRSYCGVFLVKGAWQWEPGQEGHEQMARGLYRLGIEDEAILAALNQPLSMHEKLELRLSMPRVFWPQSWLNEAST